MSWVLALRKVLWRFSRSQISSYDSSSLWSTVPSKYTRYFFSCSKSPMSAARSRSAVPCSFCSRFSSASFCSKTLCSCWVFISARCRFESFS